MITASRTRSLHDRAQGTIIGAAIGDALGMPTEGISKRTLEGSYGGKVSSFQRALGGHPCSHLRAGQYTDDTQQLIILAESLAERGGFDLDDFGRRLALWGRRCRHEPGYDRYAGTSSLDAADRLTAGISPLKSSGAGVTSCGSVMRVAPVGIFFKDFGEALREARFSSVPTHDSDVCKDAAGAVAGIINLIARQDLHPFNAARKALDMITEPIIREKMKLAMDMAGASPEDAATAIGTGCSASSTASFAIYCVLSSPDDFEKTVITAANSVPGDTDSIACIAGAISGAYNGLSSIPPRFLSVENFDYLRSLSSRLV
ncbi:MAG: ADP-ribosylglycohydrolase family protein [Candidatus Micrarchaeia archaeon]